MFKKPDLRIDTQFFDDNLNGLNIPEAIRVTQSLDTQTFIKEGLNDEENDSLAILAIQTIEKIVSQHLFDNFLACWSRLKQCLHVPLSHQSTPISQRGHRRITPLIRTLAETQQINLTQENAENRGIARQKFQLHKLQGSEVEWLDEQHRNIKSKSVLRGWSTRKCNPAQNHYERAKVLKQIVDKLRHGRNVVTGLIQQIDNQHENEQLHHKLNKLERLMEDVHFSAVQRGHSVSQNKVQNQPRQSPKTQEISQELSIRLKQELALVKGEMQKIRLENERILREEWKRSQIARMAATSEDIKRQYKYQLDLLERQKRVSEQNNQRLHQQLYLHHSSRQEYDRQVLFLSQRVNEVEQREQNRQVLYRSNTRPIIPAQTNPFGYSTFATSQKNSQAVGNWEQSAHPVGTHLPALLLKEEGRQAADEWACC